MIAYSQLIDEHCVTRNATQLLMGPNIERAKLRPLSWLKTRFISDFKKRNLPPAPTEARGRAVAIVPACAPIAPATGCHGARSFSVWHSNPCAGCMLACHRFNATMRRLFNLMRCQSKAKIVSSLQSVYGGEHPIAPTLFFCDDRPSACETYENG